MAAVLAGGYYENESGRRLLVWAVAGSLLLHLALLFMFPLLEDAPATQLIPPPLTARLARPKPPEPAPPKTEPPQRPRHAPVAKAVPPPAPVPTPRVPSVEPAKPAAEPVFVAPVAPPARAPAAPSARAEPPAASPPAAAASGPDPGTVARFRLELMDLARRHKKYPRLAQDNNWEGRVAVRIAIGEDGAISSLTVQRSAGHAVLDDEALAMIRTASSMATIPAGLRGKPFALDIRVDFFLKDEER